MTTILPCPFCGSDSEVEEVGLGATNGVIFTIGCASKHEDACMGYQCFQTFALRKDAIAAWNKRAPQSSAPAQCVLSGAQLDDRLEAIAALPSAPSAPGGTLNSGPDFRVVPVRVLQSAYDRVDAMLSGIEMDLRAANSVRIELHHLINETYAGPTPSAPGGHIPKAGACAPLNGLLCRRYYPGISACQQFGGKQKCLLDMRETAVTSAPSVPAAADDSIVDLRMVLENQLAMMGFLNGLTRGFLVRDDLAQERLSARIQATISVGASTDGGAA